MAVDLAVRLGAKRVVLAGADFGFVGGRGHAAGVADPGASGNVEAPETWVLNGLGERVPTEPKLAAYRRDLESYIAAHPKVAFLKAGREGATIAGTTWLEEQA